MQDIVITLLGLTGLLALVSLLPPLANRLRLPFTVLLAAVGCALGGIVAAVHEIEGMGPLGDFLNALRGFGISSEAFLYIFLPTLLFQAALALDLRRLMDDVGAVLLLAVVAVVVCTAIVGVALWSASDMALIVCLLLGAIVATTDPAAVIGIFREVGAPRRLSLLVEGESLFNDAAAIALFSLLLAVLLGQQEAGGGAALGSFLKSFIGGALFGVTAAWIAGALTGLLRGLRLAEITLTVSLAYLVFILAEQYLHVSGVIAVVTAALYVGNYGRTRITPSSWDSLLDTWDQLGFWANSLIFLLAAMLVPHLLTDIGLADASLLAVLVGATLLSRALVLYGLLPAMSMTGLARSVSGPYKAVILWGGLRGAVSLALALAITEHTALSPEIRHFIAILATGFVLFTLFVNGTTLRPLIRLLRLDRLSPADHALRDRALEMTLTGIRERIEAVAGAEQIDAPVVAEITDDFLHRIVTVGEAQRCGPSLSEDDLVYIGLVTLAGREEELYLERFKERLISRKIVQVLLTQAGQLYDGAKTGGRPGYEAAADKALAFSPAFRAALLLQRRLGSSRWLAAQLADRFETLLIGEMVLRELVAFNGRRIAPLLGQAPGRALAQLLDVRLAATTQALSALKLQYPDYARALQAKYLGRVALRLEEEGYKTLLAESAISQEVYNDLSRQLTERWHGLDRRPALDVALEREAMIARVPLFAGVEARSLGDIARLLRPRLAVPGERIITEGERGDAMYFIASGAVEVKIGPTPVRLGSGEFFGEIALLNRRRRTADVVTLGYCRLLVLHVRDFHRLLQANPDLRQQIDAVARQRLRRDRVLEAPALAAASRFSNTTLPSPGA